MSHDGGHMADQVFVNKVGLILVLTSAFVIVASSLLLNQPLMSQDGGHMADQVFVNKMGLILFLTSLSLRRHCCSMGQDGGHVVDHVLVNQMRLILAFNISI